MEVWFGSVPVAQNLHRENTHSRHLISVTIAHSPTLYSKISVNTACQTIIY